MFQLTPPSRRPSLDHSTSTRGGGPGGGDNSDEETGGVITSPAVGQLGEGVDGRREGENTATTSPFDRLPDELVSHILFFAELDCALSTVSLTKRLHRLAVPVWAESLNPRFDDQPAFLQRIVCHPGVTPFVRSFHGVMPEMIAGIPYECAIIRSFVNLRTLHLEIDYSGLSNLEDLPYCFTDALTSMTNLRRLELVVPSGAVLDDRKFTIGSNLPQLQHLQLHASAETTFFSQLLSTPCPNLVSLDLFDKSGLGAYRAIPWATLRSVKLGRGPLPMEQLFDAISSGLQSALFNSVDGRLPLRTFSYSAALFHNEPGAATAEAVELLHLLQKAGVEDLSLALHPSGFTKPDELEPLPSVQVLRLRGNGLHLWRPTHLRTFITFLDRFPSVHHLHLSSAPFSDIPDLLSLAVEFEDPTDLLFSIHHPTLPILLLYLRRYTTILRFEWHDGHHPTSSPTLSPGAAEP